MASSNGGSAQPDLIQELPSAAAAGTKPDVAAASNGGAGGADLGVCAVALYDYQAADDTEISFDPNQVRFSQRLRELFFSFPLAHFIRVQ